MPHSCTCTHHTILICANFMSNIFITGKLSLTSLSGDGIDRVPSFSGLSFHKYALKIMQVNSCLYHSKGMAEHLLVIDLDEFFVPRGKNWNFLDVLNSVKSQRIVSSIAEQGSRVDSTSRKRRLEYNGGWAAKHNHPACYIKVSSDIVVNPTTGGYTDTEHPWTGQR